MLRGVIGRWKHTAFSVTMLTGSIVRIDENDPFRAEARDGRVYVTVHGQTFAVWESTNEIADRAWA